jgi:hypothetical protein
MVRRACPMRPTSQSGAGGWHVCTSLRSPDRLHGGRPPIGWPALPRRLRGSLAAVLVGCVRGGRHGWTPVTRVAEFRVPRSRVPKAGQRQAPMWCDGRRLPSDSTCRLGHRLGSRVQEPDRIGATLVTNPGLCAAHASRPARFRSGRPPHPAAHGRRDSVSVGPGLATAHVVDQGPALGSP